MFAEVINGVVTALGTEAIDDTWYPCGTSVQVGWTFDGGTFTPVIPVYTPPTLTAQQQLVQDAQVKLSKTDISVVRCYSAGVSVPSDIQAYRVALRAIVSGADTTSTVLPTEPTDYPQGT